MSTNVQKSWLLGGGYDWRAFASANLAVDKSAGISLVQTREIPPTPPTKTILSHRYSFGRLCYDIDRGKREIRAYTPDGKLRHRWGPRDSAGNYVPARDAAAWDPVDMVGDANCVFILERNYQTVLKHLFGRESLALLFSSGNVNSHWSRITLDESGCLLLFDDAQPNIASRYSRTGSSLGNGKAPWPAEPPRASMQAQPTQEPPPGEAPFYSMEGYWMSQPLDSGIFNCPWHRIEMTLPQLPAGTQIDVQVFAYKNLELAPLNFRDPRWTTSYSVVAPIQPTPDPGTPNPRVPGFFPFRIPNGVGRIRSTSGRIHCSVRSGGGSRRCPDELFGRLAGFGAGRHLDRRAEPSSSGSGSPSPSATRHSRGSARIHRSVPRKFCRCLLRCALTNFLPRVSGRLPRAPVPDAFANEQQAC